MKKIDDIAVEILLEKENILSKRKIPRYLIVNKKIQQQLFAEFKDSLAYSELDGSFLRKVDEIEKEINRYDLKISVAKFYDLHVVVSDVIEEDKFLIV